MLSVMYGEPSVPQKVRLKMLEELKMRGVKMTTPQMPISPGDPHYESFVTYVVLKACSEDMLMKALVGCAGITLKAVAIAMRILIRQAKVVAD
jgi:DNA repair photolyase